MSAFADADIIRMANEDYVTVSGDDWYQRRRQDFEGEFFRKIADQGPRKGQGGSTRQGIYCFTADGELLAYKNAGQDADVMREVLQQALTKWKRLPESRRKPGAVKVEAAGKVDARFVRTPPAGGLVAVVYNRILDKDERGDFCKGVCPSLGGDRAARDHLWLTADEVKSLVSVNAKPGDSFPMPKLIAERLLRFHFVDNTRGEPPAWQRNEIRTNDMLLSVVSVDANEVRLSLTGKAMLADQADVASSKRGFDATLSGDLRFDPKKGKFVRFDITAVGQHWGEATFTRNARPGRQPFGIAIELAGDKPADRIPPQFAREWGAYMGKY